MSRLIAVSGPPNSGKTTLTLKLAQEIYDLTKAKVVYLSTDTLIPAMGLIFPKREKEKLFSIGSALENVNIAITDILGVCATTSAMPNMGYLGYKAGEGPYTYPALTEQKTFDLYKILRENFDYVFVDCDRDRENILSTIGRGLADHVIQIVNPDLKSIAYYGFESIGERSIQVLNVLDNDLYLPIQDTKKHFPGITFQVNYSRPVKMQMFNGELMDFLKDSVYRGVMKNIAHEIIAPIPKQADEEDEEPIVVEEVIAEDDNPLETGRPADDFRL